MINYSLEGGILFFQDDNGSHKLKVGRHLKAVEKWLKLTEEYGFNSGGLHGYSGCVKNKNIQIGFRSCLSDFEIVASVNLMTDMITVAYACQMPPCIYKRSCHMDDIKRLEIIIKEVISNLITGQHYCMIE